MLPIIVAVVLAIFSLKPVLPSQNKIETQQETTPTPQLSFQNTSTPKAQNTKPAGKNLKPDTASTDTWGKLIKTGDLTYTIKVADDPVMTTPDEALEALNQLRKRYGAQPLKTDSRLCEYAQQRAEFFNSINGIDAHKGFEEFLEKENGFEKLGFQRVGENSSYGYKLTGVHLIEFVYMQSPTHNQNQLNPDWDRGCVGVSGTATNFIFATSPF